MIIRRAAVRRLAYASAGAWAASAGLHLSQAEVAKQDPNPPLAPGTPTSPERLALIAAFQKQSEGLQNNFEARTLKRDWTMPYRLFRPQPPQSCLWSSICTAAADRATTILRNGPGQYLWYTPLAPPAESDNFPLLCPRPAEQPRDGSATIPPNWPTKFTRWFQAWDRASNWRSRSSTLCFTSSPSTTAAST